VTQFAAGCSICGEDLQAARARLAAHRAPLAEVSSRLRLPGRLSLPGLDDDVLRVGIALFLALFVPLLGLALAGFFAWQAHDAGRAALRNLLAAVAMLAAALIVLAPIGIWWHLVGQ
jgi:hypothetical protein